MALGGLSGKGCWQAAGKRERERERKERERWNIDGQRNGKKRHVH